MSTIQTIIDVAIGAVKVAESIFGAVDAAEARELAEVRVRLEAVRVRAEALVERGGPEGDYAGRAAKRRAELEPEGPPTLTDRPRIAPPAPILDVPPIADLDGGDGDA